MSWAHLGLWMTFLQFMALLNRFRGGGFGAERLPLHPRWYATAVLILGCGWVAGLASGLAVGISYLLWCLPPWGRWYTLDWVPMQSGPALREPSWFERSIEAITRSDLEAFSLRQIIGFVPAAILLTPWALLASMLVVGIYEMSWWVAPKNHEIQTAELVTGVVWGALILWAF